LWSFDIENLKWQHKPEPLALACHGSEYDGGLAATAGHFTATWVSSTFSRARWASGARSGLESVQFVGYPMEHTFASGWLRAATEGISPKTRENIQQLFNWWKPSSGAAGRAQRALVEGEENFEARLDAIVAQR